MSQTSRMCETTPVEDAFSNIETLETTVKQLKAQLRQAMQLGSLGAHTAAWAHELRNFMAPACTWSDIAQRSNKPEDVQKALQLALTSTRTALKMADNILVLGGLNPEPRPESVCLREAIDEIVPILAANPDKQGVQMDVDVENRLEVWIDPHSLRHILFNVIGNSYRIVSDMKGGRLQITSNGQGRCIVLEIRDTGKGMSRETKERLFDPFFSTKDENERPYCAGIGLALSKELIESAGGSISVESEPGEGATFHLEFPAPRKIRRTLSGTTQSSN